MVFLLISDTGHGSCFFLNKGKENRLYTASHVLKGAKSLNIVMKTVSNPLPVNLWTIDLSRDIAFLKQDHFPDTIRLTADECYKYCNVPRNNNVLDTGLMERVLEMYGFPWQHLEKFRRFTFLASTSINNGYVYTDNSSIQGLSGGPLILPKFAWNGLMETTYDFYGTFGVISATCTDNTGSKLGKVSLIEW